MYKKYNYMSNNNTLILNNYYQLVRYKTLSDTFILAFCLDIGILVLYGTNNLSHSGQELINLIKEV